ncbi:hypothetical protein J2S78_003144 [Salibacterium salarium]|uniref:DUF2512 family protein n=1 Tax=Salibacterium salarium TaxID=284579 RepID=UPI00277E7644|nr:DUF2512 family protein [Salibacterium salarium]MDQ0300676.1 hypothetical protein [Salibacterium salarium]
MEHAKALLIKGVTTLIVLYLILGIGFGVSFLFVFILTAIIGIVSYPGDLFIMPRIMNIPATIADFFLAFLLIWIFGSLFFKSEIPIISASILAATVLAFCEYYFHFYLATHVLPGNNRIKAYTQ